jgi:hypothetical protein
VRLERVAQDPKLGPTLIVSGADLMDGTPILDVKPYVPYADCHPEATQGFTAPGQDYLLEVNFPEDLLSKVPEQKRAALQGVLAQDPRPSYQKDPTRLYGFRFAGLEIKFKVNDKQLTVCAVEEAEA